MKLTTYEDYEGTPGSGWKYKESVRTYKEQDVRQEERFDDTDAPTMAWGLLYAFNEVLDGVVNSNARRIKEGSELLDIVKDIPHSEGKKQYRILQGNLKILMNRLKK